MKSKQLLLFFLGIIYTATSAAQADRRVDSLLTVLTSCKEDTVKVNTLNALSKQYGRSNKIPEAKKHAEEAKLLAEKIRFKNGIRDAQVNFGNIHNVLANGFMGKNNYPEALKNYLAALKIFEKNDYKTGIGYVNGNIGRFYWIQKNYPVAMNYYSKAIKVFEEIKDKNGIADTQNGIGLIYENQGKYPEALKYYAEAIKSYDEAGNKEAMINLYFNIGFLYDDQHNYPEALKNHSAALKISEEIQDKSGIAAAYNNIGAIKENQENYVDALKNFLLSLKFDQELEDKEGIALCYYNVGDVYFILKDYLNARQNLNKSLSLAKEEGLIYIIKISYDLLAKLDSTTGNWEGAFNNRTLYVAYRDSMEGDQVAQKLLKTQMQYDFDKKADSIRYSKALIGAKLNEQILLGKQQEQNLLLKENELALVSKEKQMQQLQMQKDSAEYSGHKAETERQKGQLVLLNKERDIQDLELNRQKQLKKYLLAGLVLFLVLGFFIYRNYRNRQQLKLQLLRNKIASDLHDDIGSTLSSISIFSQMAQQQSRDVIPLLETIGENSRQMLDAMADIVWTINADNDQFDKIILRMRSFAYELLGAKKIDFEFMADEDVSKMKLQMDIRKNLYLIFKEATNNIVKYSNAGKAFFSIKTEKNGLIMLIHDNGKGFDIHQSRQGNGLNNMKKRAEEIGAQFLIDSHPGNGTKIELRVAV